MNREQLPLALAVAGLAGSIYLASTLMPNVISVSPGQSIQAAVDRAQCGEIVEVQPGTYEQHVTINKQCTADNPFVLLGASRPLITGWRTRTDWASLGSGLYRRTMEATEFPANDFDWGTNPVQLTERVAGQYRVMHFAGTCTSPGDGRWSYCLNQITVNPAGIISDVLVPALGVVIDISQRTSGVIVQGFEIRGTRAKLMTVGRSGADTSHVTLRGNTFGQYPRMGVHGHTVRPGFVVEGNHFEECCRGYGVDAGGAGGGFSLREFFSDGMIVRGNTFRGAGLARWLPGWTPADEIHNTYGSHLNIKYTIGAVIEDNVLEDWSNQPTIHLDRCQDTVARRNRGRNGGIFISSGASSPISNPRFPGASLIRIEDNVGENVQTGINVSDAQTPGTAYWARIARNSLVPMAGGVRYRLPSPLPASITVIEGTPEPPTTTTSTLAQPTTTSSLATTTSSVTTSSSTVTSSTSTTVTTTTSTTTTTVAECIELRTTTPNVTWACFSNQECP